MPDITSKGKRESLPELAKNDLSLDQAVQTVRTILMNFQGFDKLNETLTLAQNLREQQKQEAKASRAELAELEAAAAQAQKDRDEALAAKDAAVKEAAQFKKQFEATRLKAFADLNADLDKKNREFGVKLHDEYAAVKDSLEGDIAGLKKDLESYKKKAAEANSSLAGLIEQVNAKNTELEAAQNKLNAANEALSALKAKL